MSPVHQSPTASATRGCMASAVTACTSPWMITRAYRPPTNGKAERVIRTLLTEWAYARAFVRSYWRTRAFDDYLIF